MVIVVDNSNIINISYASMVNIKKKENPEATITKDDLGLYFHLYLKKIMMYLTAYKDVVFCGEGHNSIGYRKSIWPPYKENRKNRAENQDYNYINDAYKMTEELLKLFRCKVLRVENCEGDDCIYQVCKYYADQGERTKIISTDKDLTQIINFYPDFVSQYNPIKQCEMKADENILLEKALIGDPSDNIKAFRGLGPKTFEKMMADKEVWNKKMTPENLQILDQVMKIIDLRKYPQEYQDAIRVEIEKPWCEFDISGIEKFMLDNGLKSCYNEWTNSWCGDIQLLGQEQTDCLDEILDIIGGK